MSKRKAPAEAAIRDKAALKKWLRYDPGVTARDAMFTCGECGHAAHALPGSAAWAKPAQLWCCAAKGHIHRRNRACEGFIPRGEYNGLKFPNEEFENQLAQLKNTVFYVGDYARVTYVQHTLRPQGYGYFFRYELELLAEPLKGNKTPIFLEELWGWPVHTLESHLVGLRASWIESGYIRGTEIRKEPK